MRFEVMRFELFIARRYLSAKRKQAAISIITVISVLGVAAGVMALIVALAITTGFRATLQRNLLGATAHVSILNEKEPQNGIEDWRAVLDAVRKLKGVTSAAPVLYGYVVFSGALQPQGGVLKGIDLKSQDQLRELAGQLKEGSVEALAEPRTLIIGSKLAQKVGIRLSNKLTVISPQGDMTPVGIRPAYYPFKVVGIFESGFYDLDANWAFTSLGSIQQILSLPDIVNSVELKIADLDQAPEVARAAGPAIGPKLAATTWMEQNRQLLRALRLDRTVTIITIGLIQLVAALNIFINLVMMVMEKTRDIAVLVSMGARREQIRRIFMAQGLLIGAAGTALGLVIGYTICFFANKYQWVRLDEEIYSMSYVPFDARWIDGIWVMAVALLVSFLATLYPSRNAARVLPAESLRYE